MLIMNETPSFDLAEKIAARFGGVDPFRLYTFLTLLTLTGKLHRRAEKCFAKHNLSGGRFQVLVAIKRHTEEKGLPSANPSQVASMLGVTRGTITGLLDGLENEGLVQRHSNPQDRRATDLTLTGAGEAVLSKVLPERLEELNFTMSALTEAEAEKLRVLLEKLLDRVSSIKEGKEAVRR